MDKDKKGWSIPLIDKLEEGAKCLNDLPTLTDIQDGKGNKGVCLILHPGSDIERVGAKWPSSLRNSMIEARGLLRSNPAFEWTPSDAEILRPFINWKSYGKTCIVVDGNHTFYAQMNAIKRMEARDFFDPVYFLNTFEKYVSVQLKTWVAAQDEGKQVAFNTSLRDAGWEVVSAQLRKGKGNDTVMGNLDHEVSAQLMMGMAKGCDTFILFAGDGDYLKHVEALKLAGKRVIIVADGEALSKALKNEADLWIPLSSIMAKSAKDRPLEKEAWWYNQELRKVVRIERHPLLSDEEKEQMLPLMRQWREEQGLSTKPVLKSWQKPYSEYQAEVESQAREKAGV